MGLVNANAVGMSGLVAAPVDVHTVTTDGTSTDYVIPAGATRIYIEVIGGGGGGAGGSGNSSGRAGGGGGGGAFARGIYDAKSIPASLTIIVGAGGNGGAGGASGAAGADGIAGGTTSVTSGTFTLSAFGGGFGFKGNTDSKNGGGGGGAAGGAWSDYATGTGAAAGQPPAVGVSRGYGCGGGGGSNNGGDSPRDSANGGTPGGGGAGGTQDTNEQAGAGGNGGDGAVRIFSW